MSSPQKPLDASIAAAPHAERNQPLLHVAVLVATGFLWGLQPAIMKLLSRDGVPEIAATGALLASIALILGAVLAARGRLVLPQRDKLAFMTINGAAEYALPLMLMFIVSRHLDAGLVTLIISTTPLLTVAIAALTRTERLNRSSLIACLLGIAAFLFMVLPQDALPSREMLPWCLAAFLIPACYASGSVYVARAWPNDMDAVQVAWSGAFFACLFLAPFWIGPALDGSIFNNSAMGWVTFVVLVTVTMVEMGLYYYLLEHAGAVFTSFSSFVMMISGFIAGAVIFGERPSMWVWLSMGLFALSLAAIIFAPKTESAH